MKISNLKGKRIIRKMFVLFTTLSIMLTLASCGEANYKEEALFPIKTGGQWGFINAKGDVVIEPQYYDVREFSQGLCAVQKELNGLWGFIDCHNKMVIRPKYDAVWFNFNKDGIALVFLNDKSIFINKRGRTVIDIEKSAKRYSDFYIDGQKAKDAQIGDSMKILCKIDDSLAVFATGEFVREESNRIGLFDLAKKKVILTPKYWNFAGWNVFFIDNNSREILLSENDDCYIPFEDKSGKWCIYEKGGQFLPIESDVFPAQWNDCFEVKKDGIWRIVDKNGQTVKDSTDYRLAFWRYRGELALVHSVKDGCKHLSDCPKGYINKKGEFAIEPIFNFAKDFKNGLAYVEKLDGNQLTVGYIDTTGKFVWSKTVDVENYLEITNNSDYYSE